jgi:hypothetical protein
MRQNGHAIDRARSFPRRTLAAWGLLLLVGGLPPVHALDRPITAVRLRARDTSRGDVARQRIVFRSDDGRITIPRYGSPGDPTRYGGRFEILNTAGSGEHIVVPLAAENWRRVPRSAERPLQGWRYEERTRHSATRRLKIVVNLAATASGARRLGVTIIDRGGNIGGYTLDERRQRGLGIRLVTGAEGHCAELGGTIRKDRGRRLRPGRARGVFLASDAAAPVDCTYELPVRRHPQGRVLVFGIDAGQWDYIDPLLAQGVLPTMQPLVSGGMSAPLDCAPANPAFPCFCPMVWTSIATGWPAAVHGIHNVSDPPSTRRVPAVWTRVDEAGGTSALTAWHTHQPIAEHTWNITGPGTWAVADEHYSLWGAVPDPGDPGGFTFPPGLLEELGLLPYAGPHPPLWFPLAIDRVAVGALGRLLGRVGTPDLTMLILHSTDKSGHLTCTRAMTGESDLPDPEAMRTLAAQWTGPVAGGPWHFGDVATQYREADLHLATLMETARWDYVVFLSDHGMTRTPWARIPCGHVHGPALRGILGVHGPGVRPGVRLPTQSVLCAAPLLAYLLGLDVSAEMPCVASGEFDRLLAATFTPAHLRAWPPSYVGAW